MYASIVVFNLSSIQANMTKLGLVLTLAIFIQLCNCECPKNKDVPVWYVEDRLFLCAVKYRGWGHDYAVNACNKCEADNPDEGMYVHAHEDYPGEDGLYDPVGSLIVKPGCTLYLFGVQLLQQ